VKAEGGSEVWLANLLKVVQETVRYNVRSAALTMQESSIDWIEFLNSYPTQVNKVIVLSFVYLFLIFSLWRYICTLIRTHHAAKQMGLFTNSSVVCRSITPHASD
jgi:hypothetical protein